MHGASTRLISSLLLISIHSDVDPWWYNGSVFGV
jgi:hypothetical protein